MNKKPAGEETYVPRNHPAAGRRPQRQEQLRGKLARELGERVLYVATAQAKDPEMETRIQIHQQSRPAAWRTLETPTGVGPAVSAALAEQPMDVVLLDCLTLLVTNLILGNLGEDPYDEALDHIDENAAQERINHELDQLLAAANSSNIPWIIVSNELGLGLVPEYPLGRLYRDLLGLGQPTPGRPRRPRLFDDRRTPHRPQSTGPYISRDYQLLLTRS